MHLGERVVGRVHADVARRHGAGGERDKGGREGKADDQGERAHRPVISNAVLKVARGAPAAMRTLALLVALPLALLATAPPQAAAWEPCFWIMNGPTFYDRACIHPTDPDCLVERERWFWEGGYSRTCTGLP